MLSNISLAQLAGPYGLHIRQLFYLVAPSEASYATLEEVPSFVDEAIPWFVLLLLLDIFYSWKKGLPDAHEINDTFTSVAAGFVQIIINKVVFRTIEISLYVWVYENWCVYPLPWDSALTWLVAFLTVDFIYYWSHRASHEINFLWSFHQVHHSSEYYNLSTALRQGVFHAYAVILFYLPQAFFIPPPIHMAHEVLNRLFQFWIHTSVIGRLGPLEFVLNTPSHHRVHHGRNRYCIDKNYAGALIIWDRIFGTFQPELDSEPVVYGLTHNVNSNDPVYIQLNHLKNVWEKVTSVEGVGHKMKALIYGPGWAPGQGRLGDPEEIPLIEYPVRKYHSGVAKWVSAYAFFQGTCIVIAYQCFTSQIKVLPWTVSMQFAGAVLAGIYVLSGLMEQKAWSPHLEVFRCIFFNYCLLPTIAAPRMVLSILQAIGAVSALLWTVILLAPGRTKVTSSKMRKE